MLTLNSVSYALPSGAPLFQNVNFTVAENQKAALIGDNGSGKSTLFKILTGEVVGQGAISVAEKPYLVPQQFGQFEHYCIADALRASDKLRALKHILNGDATDKWLADLNDDWTIEDRVVQALEYWRIKRTDVFLPLSSLSGGEKMKVFLAGLMIHHPALVLLDEPTNHLDLTARKLFYSYIQDTTATMLITSHDRGLLNLLTPVIELSKSGTTLYGGNFEFYRRQKQIAADALLHDVQSKEKELRKAREKERESMQRQQKLNARGKSKQEKSGLPTIMQNTLRNNAEKSTAKLKDVHSEKIAGISADLAELRQSISDSSKMKLDIDASHLHYGKTLVELEEVNIVFQQEKLWTHNLSLRIHSGERIAIKGANGSGKTSLIKIILGRMRPDTGIIKRATFEALYVDQEYSLIDNNKTISGQAHAFNTFNLPEHEINIRLNRFLFPKDTWDKPCISLSGGERMRLTLCCLSIGKRSPDVIILDEPTNNLDLQSAAILSAAINEYAGTLIVVSHDEQFLADSNVQREVLL